MATYGENSEKTQIGGKEKETREPRGDQSSPKQPARQQMGRVENSFSVHN